ncbi:hypothetical protein BDW02DRAFT_433397 [Decorospora gaudefroyi]|uniref:Uncharacterized protein n=1 Tax=Decorospora gaudefroyi TaxID=184978 RepID=A0A6A5K4X4_9PLEO|nr:hypothetical protein BDW02DRAFT_433397 [Decorospora gaudefroyi]
MTSPNDSHDTEDADTKETDPNADLYEQDLPSSLSTRLSSLFMLAQNDGSTNTSNRAETSTKATSRDTRAKSPVPAKSSDSAQRAEWEAIARAHTEWEKNQPAIPGVRKEESESDDERTGKEVQEEEANEFSLFIEMHEHVYSSALKNLHGEERLILPEPWHTHGEDAPLRKLTQHPALFKAYRRQEERIIVLLRERMAHLISKYPQTPALLREKSNTWMELRQHQKILATISTVKFVEEIIARMQEKMVRDLRRQDRTDTTPAWPTAHSLLNLLRDDAKCKELRKRVYRMQEVEQEYFPWRYDGVSEIFLGSSRPSVSPPPDYSTATGTVTPTSAQRSGVTFQDGPQEECRGT